MNSQYSRKYNNDYFVWQFFASYYSTILMCAFINTKLIGMFGLQKKKLENGIHVGQVIDVIVASEWRKQGIFKSLGEKAIECCQDLDMLFSLPNQNGKYVYEKAFGWKTLSKINSMCLLNGDISEPKETNENHLIEKRLFNKFYYSTKARIWRFDNHPNYKYTYIKLTTGELAITKVFRDPDTGVRFGDIVHVECDFNNRMLLRELFIKAILQLKKQNVGNITTWALPKTILRNVVESLGFTEIPSERYFCVKVLRDEYQYLCNTLSWHLEQADSEIY